MYGYAAPFYYHSVYYILLIPVVLLSIYAQIKVSSTFKRFSRVPNRRGITGAQAAGAVLRAHGVHDVQIRPCRGSLTDHYLSLRAGIQCRYSGGGWRGRP